MAETQEFHIAEYAALRAEIVEISRQMSELVRFALVAVPALVSWTILEADRTPVIFSVAASWVPWIATILFMRYRSELSWGMKNLAVYIRKIEERYADQDLGWEKRVPATQTMRGVKYYLGHRATLALMFAITLLFSTIWTWVHHASILQIMRDLL